MYHYVHEVIEGGDIFPVKVHIDKNPIDMLTKVVPGNKFGHCMGLLSIIPY